VELFVLLTGPARGFVKQGLMAAEIPFRHDVLADANELPDYYRALDLYVVTSREEGGPKALPESMASGVPLVTTRVGMAPDMIEDGKNGFLCEVEDVVALTERALELIRQPTRREQFMAEGLQTVRAYEAKTLAEQYVRDVYTPFLT
jgi:glycosyltransferase involved in cell wall biosynthesis